MNMNHKHVAPAALILALVSGACVSQDEYDEAVDLARHYQARLQHPREPQSTKELSMLVIQLGRI